MVHNSSVPSVPTTKHSPLERHNFRIELLLVCLRYSNIIITNEKKPSDPQPQLRQKEKAQSSAWQRWAKEEKAYDRQTVNFLTESERGMTTRTTQMEKNWN